MSPCVLLLYLTIYMKERGLFVFSGFEKSEIPLRKTWTSRSSSHHLRKKKNRKGLTLKLLLLYNTHYARRVTTLSNLCIEIILFFLYLLHLYLDLIYLLFRDFHKIIFCFYMRRVMFSLLFFIFKFYFIFFEGLSFFAGLTRPWGLHQVNLWFQLGFLPVNISLDVGVDIN